MFYKVNFNDLAKVKNIIKDEGIDYIIPGSGEESYLNTVQIAQELSIGNFDDLETAKLVHNKWKFKKFCLKHNISTPNGLYYKEDSDLNSLSFPIVIKPTNLSGGRGVDIVDNLNDLNLSLSRAKKVSNEIFLEEFIEGELIAYSVFLKNQKIVYGFTGKDDTYKNPYLITTAYPIGVEKVVLDRLKFDIEIMAKKLSLVDGMFHLQVIIKNQIPYIIDVTRRIPGDFYPNLMELCDNVEYSKAVVKSYIGQKLKNEFRMDRRRNFVIRHCVMSSRNGIFKELKIDNTLKSRIVFKFDLIKKNEKIEDFLTTQISILFIKLSYEDRDILNNINTLLSPIMEKN